MMTSCHRCGKPVYFAERKTSLGKDWHRQCLKCEECGKVLNPGQHAEHKGQAFCHLPCYSALFGPRITGYGVSASAYNSYGDAGTMKRRIGSYTIGGVDKEEILNKLQHYNEVYSGKNGQLEWKEVNGRLMISGLLRLHWRINKQIQFKPKDDVPIGDKMGRVYRKSYLAAINNGMEPDQAELFHMYEDALKRSNTFNPSSRQSKDKTTPPREKTFPSRDTNSLPRHRTTPPLNKTTPPRDKTTPPRDKTTPTRDKTPPSRDKITPSRTRSQTPPRRERTSSTDDSIVMRPKKVGGDIRRFHTVCYKGESRKRYSINGHFYDGETAFTPAHGTVTTVRVHSLNSTQEVIQALLDKFKVENCPDEFCLVEARRHGEMNQLLSSDFPLLERVLLGPEEDEAKIFIMETRTLTQTSHDVNQYVSLPEAVLRGFIEKFNVEEAAAIARIRSRFAKYREKLEQHLLNISTESDT